MHTLHHPLSSLSSVGIHRLSMLHRGLIHTDISQACRGSTHLLGPPAGLSPGITHELLCQHWPALPEPTCSHATLRLNSPYDASSIKASLHGHGASFRGLDFHGLRGPCRLYIHGRPLPRAYTPPLVGLCQRVGVEFPSVRVAQQPSALTPQSAPHFIFGVA